MVYLWLSIFGVNFFVMEIDVKLIILNGIMKLLLYFLSYWFLGLNVMFILLNIEEFIKWFELLR